MLKNIFVFFFIFLFSSCSVLNAVKSPRSTYAGHVDPLLMEGKLYERGSLMVAAKVLAITPFVVEKQREYIADKELTLESGTQKVLVALHYPQDPNFSYLNIKFKSAAQEAAQVTEIKDPALIENLYYFAYPFYRVFVVSFKNSDSALSQLPLEIVTSSGSFRFELKFSN